MRTLHLCLLLLLLPLPGQGVAQVERDPQELAYRQVVEAAREHQGEISPGLATRLLSPLRNRWRAMALGHFAHRITPPISITAALEILDSMLTHHRLSAVQRLYSKLVNRLSGPEIVTLLGTTTGRWRKEIASLLVKRAGDSINAADGVAILDTIQGHHRVEALHHLVPKLANDLTAQEALQIMGYSDPANDTSRPSLIYEMSFKLPDPLGASSVVAILEGVSGHKRVESLYHFYRRIQDNLSADDVLSIVGQEREEEKRGILSLVARKLGAPLSAQDVSGLLMNMTGHRRSGAHQWIRGKLARQYRTDEVVQILGATSERDREIEIDLLIQKLPEEIDAAGIEALINGTTQQVRARLINKLTPKVSNSLIPEESIRLLESVSGTERLRLHERLLRENEIHAKLRGRTATEAIRSGRFLETGDPPGWFEGQCVQWAVKDMYNLIANYPIPENRSVGNAGGLVATIPSIDSRIRTATNTQLPQVGALVVWNLNGTTSGHVGIVTEVLRNPSTLLAQSIKVNEANWGRVTEDSARRWGLTLDEARREFVTEEYGIATTRQLTISQVENRSDYRFVGYVYP